MLDLSRIVEVCCIDLENDLDVVYEGVGVSI